ncbi:hypothetical protein DCS_07285 [Drechmeria coniospora]|uniref:Uncharacterized protein n=1 Tax=Drechmeria coniospora TaxID=98403 RepID=A0A151GE31_DRECN|nr:hypothetical protein DCS_07285 [Drechmeria coniospora]KYK55322.1 hypothetical protein DCS_07285 [Drechmeria coniospora]
MDPAADDDAMAQMLGFSTFGAQDHLQKKRRYNPLADAATDAAPLHGTRQHPNSAPLSAANRLEVNVNEIPLGDPSHVGDAGSDAPSSTREADSSSKAARPAGLPERPAPGTGFVGSPPSPSGDQGQLQHHHRHNHRHNHRQRHHHDDASGEHWYEGYYDPSSNENPWERLEKARGVHPRGTWLPAQRQPASAVAAT